MPIHFVAVGDILLIIVWRHVFLYGPFFNTITTAGEHAFPHCRENCPRRVIPLLTQRAVPCIVLMLCLVIHRAIKNLHQHSPHTPLSTPLTVLRVIIATAAHTVGATSRATGGPSRMGVGAYICKADCVINANVVVLLMQPLLLPQSSSLCYKIGSTLVLI